MGPGFKGKLNPCVQKTGVGGARQILPQSTARLLSSRATNLPCCRSRLPGQICFSCADVVAGVGYSRLLLEEVPHPIFSLNMAPTPLIRSAQPGDAASITQLLASLGYQLAAADVTSRLGVYAHPDSRVFVAEISGDLVGFLSFHSIPLFHARGCLGRITAMSVDPRFHRQGVGKALITAAEAFARTCDCRRLEVTSGDHRAGDAHVFYEAMGYHVDCRRFIKMLETV